MANHHSMARFLRPLARRCIIAGCLILLVAGGATTPAAQPGLDSSGSATGADAVITLPEAVGKALASNHGLAAAREGYRAATWAHRQAKANLLPSISLESSYTRLDDETVARANAFGREITMFFPDSTGQLQPFTIQIPQTVFRDGYQTSVNGQLLVLNPAVWNGVGLAGAAKGMAEGERNLAVQRAVHQTVRAYTELLKMRSLSLLQEDHVAQAERNLAQAERLAGVGRYGEADVLRWHVEVAQQRGLLADTRRGLRVASLTLENLLGLDPKGITQADSSLPGSLRNAVDHYRNLDAKGWDEFLNRSLQDVVVRNPQLDVLAQSQALARLQHRQSLTSFLPSMTIAGSYGWQNNDTPEMDGEKTWSLTAAVSVPLFTSFSNLSGYQNTKHKARQAQEASHDARRGILLAAEAARTAMRSAAVHLDLAETGLISARRNYEIQQNRFTLGRLGNLEWIDANLALRLSEQGYHTSYYDLVLAIADYYEAMGEILALLEE
ncbi:TolC family protein [Candidatus Fermentibacteria bacterium]|nr:TolC family protein [Candidatus Fermentibacteria bacterium]